ncbi:P-loop containing nucleoside triphosphate hydrolase protein [Mycena capillaripes]|nr:P-loop containing nucleoside triphosphate hydrolase protein [Mycena capillaripes]
MFRCAGVPVLPIGGSEIPSDFHHLKLVDNRLRFPLGPDVTPQKEVEHDTTLPMYDLSTATSAVCCVHVRTGTIWDQGLSSEVVPVNKDLCEAQAAPEQVEVLGAANKPVRLEDGKLIINKGGDRLCIFEVYRAIRPYENLLNWIATRLGILGGWFEAALAIYMVYPTTIPAISLPSMDLFSGGHHTTIHGGTGGSGGQGGSTGGAGGNAEGPQFTNVTVHGDVINHFPPPRNSGSWVHSDTRNQSLGTVMAKDPKICPLPVSSFTGRKEILQKMHQYFDSDRGSVQHIFVLHGLGGSGKSQLAFKFLQESRANCREQTIQMDLQAIAPAVVGKSVAATLRWLAGKQEEWLLFFDSADDIKLDLSKFFPSCTFGNILITTRNQGLCTYAGADGDSKVSDMDPDDAKELLFRLCRQVRNNDQEKLALTIVKQAKIQGQSEYGLAVYATWDLSYNKLSPAGRSMLQICSFLHHTGISEQIFEKAAMCQEDLDDSDLQDKVTQLLNGLGTLEWHDHGNKQTSHAEMCADYHWLVNPLEF